MWSSPPSKGLAPQLLRPRGMHVPLHHLCLSPPWKSDSTITIQLSIGSLKARACTNVVCTPTFNLMFMGTAPAPCGGKAHMHAHMQARRRAFSSLPVDAYRNPYPGHTASFPQALATRATGMNVDIHDVNSVQLVSWTTCMPAYLLELQPMLTPMHACGQRVVTCGCAWYHLP